MGVDQCAPAGELPGLRRLGGAAVPRAHLVQAADHFVDRADRGVPCPDRVSVSLAERRDVLRAFEVLPLPDPDGEQLG